MEFKVPELGEGVYDAELVEWKVKPGDAVRAGDTLAEVLTDKANMDLPSPFDGVISTLSAEPGDKILVGQAVLSYAASGTGSAAAAASHSADAAAPKQEVAAGSTAHSGNAASSGSPIAPLSPHEAVTADVLGVKASPAVRRMAQLMGKDLAAIPGSGPSGRVLIEDLAKAAGNGSSRHKAAEKPRSPADDFDLGVAGSTVKMQGIRRKIAEHLVHAKRSIPHYSYVDECDVTDLVRLRASLKEDAAARGVKLTFLPFFMKAVALALKQVPLANATYDDAAGEISMHDRRDIGIAVAARQGLIVPVVRDIDHKDVFTIAREADAVVAACRTGKSKLEDLKNGTFTITSIGSIGGLIATPIIHAPQVAIMGIGKIVKRPVYDNAGNLRPADMVYLSFSFDHRVVDGAVGAILTNYVIDRLQRPATLLLPS